SAPRLELALPLVLGARGRRSREDPFEGGAVFGLRVDVDAVARAEDDVVVDAARRAVSDQHAGPRAFAQGQVANPPAGRARPPRDDELAHLGQVVIDATERDA